MYAANGTLLAPDIFSGETGSGWQTAYFSSPVSITAGTTYIASYLSPSGYYAVLPVNYFSTAHENPPLTALADGTDGSNGIFISLPHLLFRPTNICRAITGWMWSLKPPSDPIPPLLLSTRSHPPMVQIT